MSAIIKTKLKAARDALGKKDYNTARDAAQDVLAYDADNYNAYVPFFAHPCSASIKKKRAWFWKAYYYKIGLYSWVLRCWNFVKTRRAKKWGTAYSCFVDLTETLIMVFIFESGIFTSDETQSRSSTCMARACQVLWSDTAVVAVCRYPSEVDGSV